ncbi:unnamed protein product [Cyprideis torosa]|uniref:Uncharacterized protein n=1 Tax=Cyprideis torosa TaxID=163714 RepID=A0A7R8WFM2_9CRUS|nr:unnamed protein product [Cyprideis torosa]CAG0891615.1 unnamed protein product [Cyprideis torosa]
MKLTLAFVAIGLLLTVCCARPELRESDIVSNALASLPQHQREVVEEIKKMVSGLSAEEKLEFRRALERQVQAPVALAAESNSPQTLGSPAPESDAHVVAPAPQSTAGAASPLMELHRVQRHHHHGHHYTVPDHEHHHSRHHHHCHHGHHHGHHGHHGHHHGHHSHHAQQQETLKEKSTGNTGNDISKPARALQMH